MSRNLGSAQLGSWTFFASPHAVDVCGINGLPLTPNSIHILGHFQKLKTLAHGHLCCYLDILRGKHERIMVVCEHYTNSILQDKLSSKSLPRLAFEVLDALAYLHQEGIVHCCLSPGCILLDSEGHVKLTNYGLYYMTEGGTTVSFPVGVPKYVAPEILAAEPPGRNDYSSSTASSPYGPKSDIWSLGIIILELALEIELWKDCSLEEIFQTVLLFLKLPSGQSVVNSIARDHDVIQKLEEMPSSLKSFIEAALTVNPVQRPNSDELLEHALFKEQGCGDSTRARMIPDKFLFNELRCKDLQLCKYAPIKDFVAELPLLEVYYLWQLAGGDVETELRRQGLIKAKPSICTVPNVVVDEGKEFGQKKDRAFLLNDTIIVLPLDQLRQRLKAVDPLIYCPLLEVRINGLSSQSSSDFQAAAELPLVIKEKDIEYQLHRIVLFRRLLEAYPYKRPHILKEAKIDIPPLHRARVWSALLDVKGDIQSYYDAIDKETPTATDRQIEVDIPRCHQYDELLSSPTGHIKFKRLLKAWVVSHPQYVYWQGLDSLCAPFLYLNFNDEALAYSCLSSFIPKYLNNFFLKDNSSVIQEYLAVFSHLIAFHDPELTNHLDSIGFVPELYAIPWFLTMYTHVFPLHKIFHLWDTLLLGSPSFPLFVGVAILQQLRASLLSFGFNECILTFSDMPEIDIQRCVQDSIKIYCSTPKSVTFRQHEKPKAKFRQKIERGDKHHQEESSHPELVMTSLPLNVLKSEVCPRISAEELLELLDLLPQDENRYKAPACKIKLLVVDVRSHEDFSRGSIPESINIPFQSSLTPEGTLVQSPETNILAAHKGKMVVIVGSNKNSNAIDFSSRLVRLGYSRVCTLHGGIDVLRTTRVLVVRTGDL